MSLGWEGMGARVPSPKGLAEWSRCRQLGCDPWQQQALVGTTQCCRGDGAGAWERHRTVGSCSCWTPSLSALAEPAATGKWVPVPFPRDTLGITAHG